MKRILNTLILVSLSTSLIAADMPQAQKQEASRLSRAMKALDRKYNLYLKCMKRNCSEVEKQEAQRDFITAIKAVVAALAIVGIGYGAKLLRDKAKAQSPKQSSQEFAEEEEENEHLKQRKAHQAQIREKWGLTGVTKVTYNGEIYFVGRIDNGNVMLIKNARATSVPFSEKDSIKPVVTASQNLPVAPESENAPVIFKEGDEVMYQGNKYKVAFTHFLLLKPDTQMLMLEGLRDAVYATEVERIN